MVKFEQYVIALGITPSKSFFPFFFDNNRAKGCLPDKGTQGFQAYYST
jgi:hypothetical protein